MAQGNLLGNINNDGGNGSDRNNNNNNKPKNTNQKKVSQRGLGVAQLERLRLEDERKREALQAANAFANNAIGSSRDPSHVTPGSNSGLLTASNMYRPVVGLSDPSGHEITNNEIGVSSWPGVWSDEYNNNNNFNGGNEKQGVDDDDDHDVKFAFGPQINLNLLHEPNSLGSLVSGHRPQRLVQFQNPPSSSMVKGSSGISPSSFSSSENEQTSIQSGNGTNSTSSWSSVDNKIDVGIKRAYPFHLKSPPAPMPSFLHKFHASGSRSDEFWSTSDEPGNKYIKDGHLSLTLGLQQNPVEDKRLMGDFLSLAPPIAAFTPPNSKNKPPSSYSHLHGLNLLSNQNTMSSSQAPVVPSASTVQTFNFFPIKPQTDQTSAHNTMSSSQAEVGPSTPTIQTFNFFPINPQTNQTSAHVRNDDEEKEEELDLDLKL